MVSAILIALAMQTTNTTCSPGVGGTVQCQTQSQPAYQFPHIQTLDVGEIYRAAQAGRAAREQVADAEPAPKSGGEIQDSFQRELAQRMGILARQSRCEDAYRLAALAGESELADASRSICPF